MEAPEGTRRTRLNAAQRRESILAAAVAARTIADHLADLIRRGQGDGDIRADLDPGPAAWLLLSVLSTRAFRTAVTSDPDRVEDGITALALRILGASPADDSEDGPR